MMHTTHVRSSLHWLPRPFRTALPAADDEPSVRRLECVDPDDEEDLGDEEDLSVAEPLADEESNFDDFDDEFDDDFEEEENDPDWDHPDDAAPGDAPPGRDAGRRK